MFSLERNFKNKRIVKLLEDLMVRIFHLQSNGSHNRGYRERTVLVTNHPEVADEVSSSNCIIGDHDLSTSGCTVCRRASSLCRGRKEKILTQMHPLRKAVFMSQLTKIASHTHS